MNGEDTELLENTEGSVGEPQESEGGNEGSAETVDNGSRIESEQYEQLIENLENQNKNLESLIEKQDTLISKQDEILTAISPNSESSTTLLDSHDVLLQILNNTEMIYNFIRKGAIVGTAALLIYCMYLMVRPLLR